MFRLIFWTIIVYFIFKFIRRLINAFLLQNSAKPNDSNLHGSGVNGNPQSTNRNHYNIDKKDIVDAQFVEIKPEKEAKTEDKNKPDNE